MEHGNKGELAGDLGKTGKTMERCEGCKKNRVCVGFVLFPAGKKMRERIFALGWLIPAKHSQYSLKWVQELWDMKKSGQGVTMSPELGD